MLNSGPTASGINPNVSKTRWINTVKAGIRNTQKHMLIPVMLKLR